MQNINKPLDKIVIGYNKPADEYIGLLEEKNKLKKDLEKSREHQEIKRKQEKEKGFNIHINGANEERIKEQRRQEILNKQQQRQQSVEDGGQQKIRRMWRDPNSVEGRKQEEAKYQNPFDLGGYDKHTPIPIPGEKSPSKIRKRWGANNDNQLGGNKPTKAIHHLQGNQDDEDDYSDEFEEGFEDEDQNDQIKDDYDDDQDNQGSNEIEQFLRTATMADITSLKQSLGNFGEFTKQLKKEAAKKEEDDYIEEDFEELIDSDLDNNDDDSDEEERKRDEKMRQEQQRLQQLRQAPITTSHNKQGGAKNRPISATYNLVASQKLQTQRTEIPASQNMMGVIQPAHGLVTNREQTSSKPGLIQSSSLGISQIQETPKQPNDQMKKPINTNPFKRPFSQNVPKRPENNIQSQNIQEAKKEVIQNQNKTSDLGFGQSSASKVPMTSLLQRIELLDEWQKEKLMEILNNFDNLTSSQMSHQIGSVEQQYPSKPLPSVTNLDLNFLSPGKLKASQLVSSTNSELTFRVLKTLGNPHICGLTELEIFDLTGKKIPITPAQITIKNIGNGPKNPVARMVDGHKLTNEEKHMWIGYLPMHPKNLEIVVQLQKNQEVGGFKIWNYNKSALDCTKGIREMQILQNDQVIWEGSLESGKGSTNIEYATFIQLKENIDLPREIQPKAQEAIQEEYEEEESKDNIKISQVETQEEQMRKYRSEAQMLKPQQKQGNAPIWLNSASKPSIASQRPQDNKQTNSTFDLLDKYSTSDASQQKKQAQSAVGSARPHPLREQQQKIGSSTASLIKPNAGQAVSSNSRPRPSVELSSNKQWTQPFSVQKQEAMQDASDAIKQAVNKVNQVMSNQTQLMNNKRHVPQVEESLDNLDFFKATNRGRLFNINDNVKQQDDKPKPQRLKWGVSPQKSKDPLQDTQLSAGKHKAHVVVKNPFPSDNKSQGSARNTSRKSERQQNNQDSDILDQFINQNNKQSKGGIEWPSSNLAQQPDYQSKASKQQSLSPARDTKQKAKQPKSFEERLEIFGDSFVIPNLPQGQKIQFNILSTWGDMNYVGLTGIEVFDIEGHQLSISGDQISACPPDINILPGYGGDPRTIDKLVDGHYITNDDLHVWLTPFTAGEDHTITIDLGQKKQLSMIRLWNYNKSRIHSYRGARLITIELDDRQVIFRGEIAKAPGTLSEPENCCEIIMFTDNERVLERIDHNDWLNEQVILSDMEDTQRILSDLPAHMTDQERPLTATKKFNTAEIQEMQRHLRQQQSKAPVSLFDERPQTAAIVQEQEERKGNSLRNRFDQKHQELSQQVKQLANQSSSQFVTGRYIELNILDTWGDLFYVGLTGLEVLDDKGVKIALTSGMIDANPRDMNSIPGHGSDYRTLDKLIDGVNNTQDDHHMWLVPFNKGESHLVKIDLIKVQRIGAIRVYNYNKSEEDTMRGAKIVTIQVDKKYVTNKKGLVLRKAPGLVHQMLDFGQEIKLPFRKGWTTEQIAPLHKKQQDLGLFQECELVNLPMGFLFRINLYSTHGDFFYIGLNGIEMYDQNGHLIKIQTIVAEPQGVHQIKGMENDIRVVTNLINNQNNTFDESNMWLAPFKNTRSYSAVTTAQQSKQTEDNLQYRIPNYVYVVFDQPTAVSALRIWNYAKTPSRGVNEFEVLVDDKQVYRGFAKQAPEKSNGNEDWSTVVLFTAEQRIVDRFQSQLFYDPTKSQEVTMYFDKKLMNKHQLKRPTEDAFVALNEMQRPTTMARR